MTADLQLVIGENEKKEVEKPKCSWLNWPLYNKFMIFRTIFSIVTSVIENLKLFMSNVWYLPKKKYEKPKKGKGYIKILVLGQSSWTEHTYPFQFIKSKIILNIKINSL